MKRLYEICRARFRRWCYLLSIGQWRFEYAYSYYEFLDGKERLAGLASGGAMFQNWKVWWRDPDNSIMELQDYWIKEHAGR